MEVFVSCDALVRIFCTVRPPKDLKLKLYPYYPLPNIIPHTYIFHHSIWGGNYNMLPFCCCFCFVIFMHKTQNTQGGGGCKC